MSRQQAPEPVVRPLTVLTSATAIRDLTLAKPVNENGFHVAYFVPRNFTLEAGEESVVPLISIYMTDDTYNLHIAVCDYGPGSSNGHAVDATGITTNVICDELPCAVETSDIDEGLDKLATYLESMSSDGFELDELSEIRKGVNPDAHIDAIIDI